MQQLRFTGMDEGGRLVVVADDGTPYAVPVDDQLRAALRPRPHQPHPERPDSAASPRDVQAMIRAGQTAEEVAKGTGWELSRVQRFEAPIRAERDHVVGLARGAHVRSAGRADSSQTLERRVRERLQARGVDLTEVAWDAYRTEHGSPWTAVVAFSAGGRERRAAWHYDVASRSIEALDDEARWLSEDEQALPGGLSAHPLLGAAHRDDSDDLMTTMRERSRSRGRRPRRREDESDPTHVPGQQAMPEDLLPLEPMGYDPATMGDPPAAHPRPQDEPDIVDEIAAELSAGVPTEAATQIAEPGASPTADEPREDRPEPQPRKQRERRRLRMPRPKLPTLPDDRDEAEAEEVPEGTFARHHRDPQEVTFEEFFGLEDEEGIQDDDLVDELHEVDLEEADLDGVDLGEVDLEEVDLDGVDPVTPDDAQEAAPHELPEAALGTDDLAVDYDVADEAADVEEALGEQGESPASLHDNETHDLGTDDLVPEDEPVEIVEEPEHEPEKEPEQPEAEPAQPETAQQRSASSRRKGRASVPSWDDIMFGSRDQG